MALLSYYRDMTDNIPTCSFDQRYFVAARFLPFMRRRNPMREFAKAAAQARKRGSTPVVAPRHSSSSSVSKKSHPVRLHVSHGQPPQRSAIEEFSEMSAAARKNTGPSLAPSSPARSRGGLFRGRGRSRARDRDRRHGARGARPGPRNAMSEFAAVTSQVRSRARVGVRPPISSFNPEVFPPVPHQMQSVNAPSCLKQPSAPQCVQPMMIGGVSGLKQSSAPPLPTPSLDAYAQLPIPSAPPMMYSMDDGEFDGERRYDDSVY